MITTLDTTPWSLSDLTGNGQLAIVTAGSPPARTFYLVSNIRQDGTFVVLKSVDFGYHWTTVGTHSLLTGTKAFDPAVCLDSLGILHIVGSQISATPNNYDIIHLTFDTNSDTLSTTVNTLVTSSRVASDYDLIALQSGNIGFAVSVIDPSFPTFSPPIVGNCLIYCIMSPSGSPPAYNFAVDHIIDSSPFRTGNTFGAVTLYSPDAVNVEVYYNSHPKGVTFKDVLVQIFMTERNGAGQWGIGSPPVTQKLTEFSCRFVDDKLTVVGYGTNRYISNCYFTYRAHFGTSGHMLLGATADLTNWAFSPVLGTPTASFVEPTLSLSDDLASPPVTTLKLAYLVRDLTTTNLVSEFKLADVDPQTLNITDLPSIFNTLNFTWLRGTQALIDPTSKWLVIGERDLSALSSPPLTNIPTFVSGFNVPPVVILEPTTLTANRNQNYLLDASASTDADLDPIQFTWEVIGAGSPPSDVTQIQLTPSTDGKTAVLFVPNSIGPAALNFTVVVKAVDLDQNGDPIHTPATGSAIGTCAVSVPFNTAPTISFDPPLVLEGSPPAWTMSAHRNSSVSITPVVNDSDSSDSILYLWEQVAGTPVTTLTAASNKTLRFLTNGVNVHGETLQFLLTVSDQVNSSVTALVDVVVDEYDFTETDVKVLNRSIWGNVGSPPESGVIAHRNSDGGWGALIPSQYKIDVINLKRSQTQGGDNRVLYISPFSVLVLGDSVTEPTANTILLRRLFPPTVLASPPSDHTLWIDAIHTETDYTICLGRDMVLYQYTTAPLVSTDDPTATINLGSLTTFQFTKMFCTATFADRRVIVLTGPQGLVLLQIRNSTFGVSSFLEISAQNSLLYGADNVQWVRTDSVESIHQGTVLVGTMDANGATFETYIDLPHRQIIGTWDKSKLRNEFVATGEILFKQSDEYVGRLLAPRMLPPTSDLAGNVTLTWNQLRPDLVNQYIIEYSLDGTNWSFLTTIGQGSILQYTTQITQSTLYNFRMYGVNSDGNSPFSNVVQVITGTIPPPVLDPLTITSLVSGYSIELDWSLLIPSSFVQSFSVQQSIDGADFVTIAAVPGGTLTYTASPVTGGHTYTYRVSALTTTQGTNTAPSTPQSVTLGQGFGFDFGDNFGF